MGRRFRLGANILTKVILPSSTTPTYTNLTVIPTTTAQNYTVPSGYTGYNHITVSAVNSNIDANIVPGNIRNGVSILGVTGNYALQTYYVERVLTTGNKLTHPTNIIQTEGIKDIGTNALSYAYYCDTALQGEVCFSDLVTVTGENAMANMCWGCNSITSVNFPKLTSINAVNAITNSFYNCLGLTTVNLCNLTTVNGMYAMYFAFCTCNEITSINLSNLTTIGNSAMQRVFINTKISTLDLSSLTTINSGGLEYCFGYSGNLTSLNLSNLTTVGSSGLDMTFYRCNNLTTINLPSIVNIEASSTSAFYRTFGGCISLVNVYFNSLSAVKADNAFRNTFENCTSLATINFPALSYIPKGYAFYNCFSNCSSLRSVYFPALTTTSFGSNTIQFKNMLIGVNNCVVHFPSSVQSKIGSWTDVTGGFGGTNCRAAFDLPATS